MSNALPHRPPLGLPPGSVRGILCLMIVLQFWLLLLLPDSKRIPIPVNLYLLMTVVAIFFVSHGKSIATAAEPAPSPLHLPGGTLRVVILGGTIAIITYLWSNYPDRFYERLQIDPKQINLWPMLIGAYFGGFTIGYLLRFMPFKGHWLFQSMLAWLSILAMALLGIELFIEGFIQASLKEHLSFSIWQFLVTAVTTCYFGTRS